MRRILSIILALTTLVTFAVQAQSQELCSGPHCTNGQYWPGDNGYYNDGNNGYYQQPYYGGYQQPYRSSSNNGGEALLGAVAGALVGTVIGKGLDSMSQNSQRPTRFDPDSHEDSVLVGPVGEERKYRYEAGCRFADEKFQTHPKYIVGSCGKTAYFFSRKDGRKLGRIPYAN